MAKTRAVLINGSRVYMTKEDIMEMNKNPTDVNPTEEAQGPIITEEPTEKELLMIRCEELGIKVKRNWGIPKMTAMIEAAETEEEIEL